MRFAANRAILGAIALIVVGVVVSMMSSNYVLRDEAEFGLIRSRWWWELVLNSQILCAAFIWFTHIDKVKAAQGARFWARLLQMLAGLVAVLLPVWVAIIAAMAGWFEERPSMKSVDLLITAVLAAWAVAVLILWAVNGRASGTIRPTRVFKRFGRWRVLGFLPSILALLLVVVESRRGGVMHYMYGPFLLYLQGAMPYLARSFRFH